MRGFGMNKIIIEQKHKSIIQDILYYLLQSPAFKPCLQDGVPLLHLVLRVGHVYHQSNKQVDLLKLYLEKGYPLDLKCPWTGSTSLDVAFELNLLLESDMLLQKDCFAWMQLEAQQRFQLMEMPPAMLPEVKPIPVKNGLMNLENALQMLKDYEQDFKKVLASSIFLFGTSEQPEFIAILKTIE